MPCSLWFNQAPQAVACVFVILFVHFLISVLDSQLEHTGLLSGLSLLDVKKSGF